MPSKTTPTLRTLKSRAKRDGWKWDDYVKTENDRVAIEEGCWVFPAWGEHVCMFFEKYLRHCKDRWAGKPFILAPCQRDDIIMPAFSWARPDGQGGWVRRFTEITIFVAKKNFKSTLASGLVLYGLKGDGVEGAEVYCVANAREQASIVFRSAVSMVKSSPELGKTLKCLPSTKTIMDTSNTSTWMRALSADASSAEGLNASMVVVDEIHKFDARGTELFDAVRYSGAARRQPLLITISTAGDDFTGVGYEVYSHAKAVMTDSTIDTTTFAYIREAGKDDDPGSPKTWRKANPMIGITISEEELAQQWTKAKGSPRKISVFKRYRCNMWVDAADPWLDMAHWENCGGDLDPADLAGKACGAGLDLATKSDLTAFAMCFSLDDDVFAYLVHYFFPNGDIVLREKKDRCKYRQWAEEGWLTLTEGDTTDMNAIEEHIVLAAETYSIGECGYDPWNAHNIAQRLQDDHGLTMVEMRQGAFTLSEPSKKFETLVTSERMVHLNDPVLRQQASQVVVTTNTNGNIRPVKSLDAGKRWFRIDGIMACVMATARVEDVDASPYETRGVRTFGETVDA